MASPTETQVQTKFKDVCKLVKSAINYGGVSGTPASFDSLQTTILGDAATDYDAELESSMAGMRAQIDAAVRSGSSVLSPVLRAYGKVAKFAETDSNAILANLYNWFVGLYPGNPGVQTIVSRQFAYGAVTAVGSPSGNGVIYRLTKDPYGYDLEACYTQTTIARCVKDQSLGAPRNEESFELRTDAQARDEIIRLGSGAVDQQNFRSMSARDSILLNASFESCQPTPVQGGGSTPTANPTGWNLDVLANFQVTQDVYYRDYLGLQVGSTANPPVALRFTTNSVITQPFSARNVPLQPLRPYFFQVPIYRESSADGTVTLALGPLSPFTPTSAATAALVATASGNLSNGTYSYKVSFVGPFGESIASAVSNTVTVDASHKQVTLSSIPVASGQNMTGAQSVTSRKLYRCAVGNAVSGPWLLVGTLLDNFTTTFTDNVADGSLGAACLTSIVATRSVSTTVSSLTNNAWSLLQFPVDERLYYKNWQANGLALTVSYTARTTGSIVVDEVGVWPFQPFAGSWAVLIGGTSPWLYNDQYKWVDSALGSTCQEILWRSFTRYLPAVPLAPSGSAISAADGAAGSVNAGQHTWAVTFVGNKAGKDTTAAACVMESGTGASVVFTTAGSKTVNLTNIPLGGTGIVARRIYRSAAGTSTPLKFVAEIADNVTTTYNDSIADASLGYTAPTGATILDA